MSLTVSETAGLQISKYFNFAGMAILIFDYVITFEDEVRWVWGRRWDVTRIVFTVSRYLPFVGAGFTAYTALHSSPDHPCRGPALAENITHILGITAAELLLVMRTYALWQCDRRVLYGLLAYAGLTLCGAIAIKLAPKLLITGGGHLPSGCILVGSRNSIFVYVFLLMFEMVILLLMSWKRFRAYPRQVTLKASILHVLYRDGIFYVVCIILITFANIIVEGITPQQFSDLLDMPQIAIHSVVASRILFNLRKNAERSVLGGTTNTEVTPSKIDFAPPFSQHTTESDSESSVIDIRADSDVEVARSGPPLISNV